MKSKVRRMIENPARNKALIFIKEKADELSKSNNIRDMEGAMKGYGCTGNLKQMDGIVKGIIKRDIEQAMDYSELGDKFHKMHGN